MKQQQTLNGKWTLEILGDSPYKGEQIPVTIPGSVYSALLEAGKMPDPYWRDNELEALKLMQYDFAFTTEFNCDYPAPLLVCDGLDTICDIELNGHKIGYANNMHRRWEFDLSKHLNKNKPNKLKLLFHSPTKYIAEKFDEVYVEGSGDAMRGFPHIRKAHCMFGWDWGPRLPDAGIWRDISIVNIDKAVIDSVYITQNHKPDGNVELTFDVELVHVGDVPLRVPQEEKIPQKNLPYTIRITDLNNTTHTSNGELIIIENPQLWWPNGYGEQPLYTVEVTLYDENKNELDRWERRIGLRTLEVIREKDEWGESFKHRVNGIDIFAMGADYIPEDNILSRITTERKRALLEDCIAANFNIVRIWGGGYYPGDDFYDICDELGIMVWQDFMFACAIYELTPEFEANIRAEVVDNVKRLRHHASLALWCGNNEIEWQQGMESYTATPKQKADYIRMFEYIIPQEAKAHDPNRFYWYSSPSSGGGFDEPNSDDRGNVHNWEVWHGLKPFSEYRNRLSRYISEFGFQSFPCLKTIKSFTEPEDRNIFSRIMEMHQRNCAANGRIMYYLSSTYRYPTEFEHLLYASQLLQAEAIRYGVEHWRRNRGRCMGTIYWQINDIWPVASWASLDYFGRWKALHYYAKRFYAPVLISCMETGEMTERPFCVAEPSPIKKAAKLAVSNESLNEITGTIKWALRDASANIIINGEEKVKVKPQSSLWLYELDFSGYDELSTYFSYELEVSQTPVHLTHSSGTVLFCMPKHFNFIDPKLTVTREGEQITVSAAAYAKSVEIYSDDEDFVLSDNFFDINAGSTTVNIVRGNPKNLKVRSVYEIGR
ncbi:MAG: glycoside hydrolase family 2 protein [Oscillospiraceae bacterium]|nr:glycoside hydrolase family 2 protein [Oscillospiraceae bacterium]